jgi:hypothetical protein
MYTTWTSSREPRVQRVYNGAGKEAHRSHRPGTGAARTTGGAASTNEKFYEFREGASQKL